MTVSITSSLRVALVSGSGVSFNAPVVQLISTDDVYDPNNPAETLTELLDAISSAKLAGSAVIDGTTAGNTTLYTVPTGEKFIPTSIVFALTNVSGTGEGPAVNVGFTDPNYNDYIDSTIGGTYALTDGSFFAGGSGYSIGDVLTLSGGTHTVAATVTLSSLKLASTALNAAGTVYAPGDTITLAGGVATTRAILTVSTVKLVSATINAGGTGYGNAQTFDVTVAGGTHSVVATVNVTTDSGGVVTTINSVSAAGSYTVLPTLTGNVVTGDNGTDHGTGLTLNLVFGVNTFTVSTSGEYTTASTTFTQFATSGSGSGATFNTALFGALAYTISNAGTYSVLPSNHVSTTGGGTGATFDALWEISAGSFFNTDSIGELVEFTDFGSDGSNFVYAVGGDVIKAKVAFASDFDTYSMKVFLFGFNFS